MGARVRAFDWASTPLGPIASWSTTLRITVDQMLASKFPACLFWGPDLIAIYNDGYHPMLGGKPQALGRPMRETWQEAWPQLEPIARRALAGESTFIEDYLLRTDRNGQMEDAYFTFNYGPVFDENGVVVAMLDTVVETTSKVLAEADLRQLNATLEQRVIERTLARGRTWQLSPEMLCVLDAGGCFEATNPAWEKTLGWSEAQMYGAPFQDFVHPEDLARSLAAWAQASERGQPVLRLENRYRTRAGGWRWLSWVSVPEDDKVYCIARDVTDEKEHAAALTEAQEALRHAQKMEAVGQLTGGIAHDFNNLLASISGALQLMRLRLDQGQPESLRTYLDMGERSVRRAASLTQRLLAFSRRQTLDPKPTDVNQLVQGMVELIARTVGPGVQVCVQADPAPWPTRIDAPQLENALLNLCINARDAMPDGGRLVLATCNLALAARDAAVHELPAGDYVCLRVTDTGTGMPQSVVQRVFDPFFTTKPLGQGTGLGLSMVYGFVRQSGGQVGVDSAPGQGTTMTLFLPRHVGASEPDEADRQPTKPDGGVGETVLLIEDEEIVRELLAEVLGEAGYTVLCAADGPAGLRQLQAACPIDLLVTDVGLPGGMNGRQVADAGRVLRPDLQVLFITGYAEAATVGNGFMEAGMEVMTKPFDLASLVARVREMLDRPAAAP